MRRYYTCPVVYSFIPTPAYVYGMGKTEVLSTSAIWLRTLSLLIQPYTAVHLIPEAVHCVAYLTDTGQWESGVSEFLTMFVVSYIPLVLFS